MPGMGISDGSPDKPVAPVIGVIADMLLEFADCEGIFRVPANPNNPSHLGKSPRAVIKNRNATITAPNMKLVWFMPDSGIFLI